MAEINKQNSKNFQVKKRKNNLIDAPYIEIYFESIVRNSKKGFKILGIDNNTRRFFFGKDGDINWVKRKLKKDLNNYQHLNIDIRNFTKLEKIFKRPQKTLNNLKKHLTT